LALRQRLKGVNWRVACDPHHGRTGDKNAREFGVGEPRFYRHKPAFCARKVDRLKV